MMRQSVITIVAAAVCLGSSFLVLTGCGHKEELPPPVPVQAPTQSQSTLEDAAAKGREADAKKRMEAMSHMKQ